jgi:Co/Zn/Cd efflux system component
MEEKKIESEGGLEEVNLIDPREQSSTENWKIKKELFKIKDLNEFKRNKLKNFYEKQNEFIEEILEDKEAETPKTEQEEQEKKDSLEKKNKKNEFIVNIGLQISFFSNIFLFIIKLSGATFTLSLSVISSAIDSFLDLFSGLILYLSNKLRKKKSKMDFFHFPVGKSRLEPIGFIVFAAVMATANVSFPYKT